MNIKTFLKKFVIFSCILITSYNVRCSTIKLIPNHVTNSINEGSLKMLQLEQPVLQIQNMNFQDLSPIEKKNCVMN